MRVMLFHQFFLGENDPGGSRWNQFVKYFTHKDNNMTFDVMAGNIHYATGEQVGRSVWYNKEVLSPSTIVHRTWTYSGYNTNFFGRLIGYFSYTMSSLMKALFLVKPDIIIVTSPSLFVGISALIVSKIKRVPFIFEVRDLWPESAITTGVLSNKYLISMLYKLEATLYKNAKKIIVLTPAFKENIVKRFSQYESKIEVITNGADFDIYLDQKRRYEIRERYGWKEKRVFAYFGAHGVANDLEQILDIAKVYRNHDNIVFVLIGDGMQKGYLKGKAQEYQLNNVQFIDSVPKSVVNDYIHASDICMATLKKTDTFKTVYPNKVFDYMRCKKPVLITIDGITRELIETAVCGIYAEPENTDALQNAVELFLQMNTNELESMGTSGYEYVQKYFDRNKLALKYLTIIQREMDATKTVK